MRKLIVLLVAIAFTQCNSVKMEVDNYDTNKRIVQKAYPSSHVEVVRGFNYIFNVSDPSQVRQVKVKGFKIAEVTTLRTFGNATASTESKAEKNTSTTDDLK